MHLTTGVHGTGLDHSREKQSLANTATVDRRAGKIADALDSPGTVETIDAVSYTHLDVYKRQVSKREKFKLGHYRAFFDSVS